MIHRRERYATVMPMAVDVDARTEKSNFDAMEAVREGDVDGVRIFLERGGEVNLCSVNTERTLLHVACRQVSKRRLHTKAVVAISSPTFRV